MSALLCARFWTVFQGFLPFRFGGAFACRFEERKTLSHLVRCGGFLQARQALSAAGFEGFCPNSKALNWKHEARCKLWSVPTTAGRGKKMLRKA